LTIIIIIIINPPEDGHLSKY